MPIKMPRHPAALALALAMFLQGVGLIFLDTLSLAQTLQWLAVGLAVAALTHEVWRNRMRLDHRIDMFVVMMAFGGLGMLAGMGVDMALADSAMGGHGGHGGGLTWASFKASLMTWMTALMLLGGIPPTWFMTRCARLASLAWRRWIATHLIGNAGMVIGMIAMGKWFGGALGMKLGAMMTGRHLAMLVGMLVGMELFQFAAETAFGLKPWQKVEIPAKGGMDKKNSDEIARNKEQSSEPVAKK